MANNAIVYQIAVSETYMKKSSKKTFENYEYSTPLDLDVPKWSVNNNGIAWTPGSFSANTIPSGIFVPVTSWDSPPYLRRIQFSTDKLVNLPDDPSSKIIEHIVDFWSKEEGFRELGVTYKRGIMLYGPPGSGKSVTIYRLATMLEQYNAVMILARSANTAKVGIELVKTLEPKRKLVVIFEDIDGIIRRESDEDLTHLLDGGTDVDNVLFIATTNYPERIPPRILNRPSRFDVIMKIDMPSAAARRAYINSLVKENLLVNLQELVEKTEGLSIAAIKEVIILTQIFGYTVDAAVTKVKSTSLEEADTDELDMDDDSEDEDNEPEDDDDESKDEDNESEDDDEPEENNYSSNSEMRP